MNGRKYIDSVAGIVMASGIAGCLQGDAVLHKKRISPTSSTKEWEVELEEGNQMRLELKKKKQMIVLAVSMATFTALIQMKKSQRQIAATLMKSSKFQPQEPTSSRRNLKEGL